MDGGRKISMALLVAVAGLQAAGAAEIQLRPECRCQGAVVTLGEVAQIHGSDPQQAATLGAVELFPIPVRPRFVRVREIQDLLMLRGIRLSDHHFSGASQVALLAEPETRPADENRILAPGPAKKAQRDVNEAIARWLASQDPSRHWVVESSLGPEAAIAVAAARSGITASGAAPRVGVQRFELSADTPEGRRRLGVEARVDVVADVVVAVRSLPRGATVRPDDVQLQRSDGDLGDGFHSLAEVVGKETTRAIPEGRPLDRLSLRSPLAVRRSEVITVYARSAGIRVRTTARAREDGSVGDLVAVESLLDRKVFTARVCGIQEAEVFAQATRVEQGPMGPRQ